MATISGDAIDIFNIDAGSGSLDVALCGYGGQVPRGPQGILPNAENSVTIDDQGQYSFEVAGNDIITPAGTYYTVTVRNANGDIVQVNAYVFADSQAYDLNIAIPFDPSQQPPPQIPPLINSELLIVPYDPAAEFPGDVYTAWQITLTGDCAPTFTDLIEGNLYTVIIIQDGVGGHQWLWPANVLNATGVDQFPNSITIQTFVASAGNLYPIGPATYWP